VSASTAQASKRPQPSAASSDPQPWDRALYQVVRDNVATLYRASEEGFSAPLPKFVRAELDGLLGCGVLGRGFAHLQCKDCGKAHLVAFRCGGRGFCPTCCGRRMAEKSANLTEFVLPEAPLRQWVLTVPHGLRAAVAYDRHLLPQLYRIFYSSIQRFYQHRMAEQGHHGGRTGSVTAIQRSSSDLRLNPHLHGVWLDGVYVQGVDGQLSWSPLPALSDRDVQEVLQAVIARLLTWLRREGRLTDDDALAPSEPDDEQQLVLGALASAAVSGSSLAGPEERPGRVPQLHLAAGQPRRWGRLLAGSDGFTLHARTTVAQGDKAGRERLIKYILRPPLAAERVERLEGGRVRLRLKRAFSDGTSAIEMDELSLVARLAALVPPPWQNQVRYSGVLSPASKLRSAVLPKSPDPDPEADPKAELDSDDATTAAVPKGKGCRYWPWYLLMARTFGSQAVACPHCDGELSLRALVKDADTIHRILTHLGLPTDIPRPAAARAPPYYRGKVTRRRPGDCQQQEMLA